ncbi:hypothetical protein HU200_034022 [Digitaria exilis]|uniref:RING-type E3 ubiquitin transferase n=1 Tax=Digitaria exilis TaxID=1010633 RepID=A0A835EP10_9POAL|nr:hypothetical protein HU200_034022 [Digitaria exilis]
MRHLLASAEEHLAAVAAAPASSPASVHTDTFLILAAVLCFLLCVVGLAFVARCSRLCNPSAYSLDAGGEAAAMPALPRKGIEVEALRKLPTVAFSEEGAEEEGDERPECAICLAEFASGDEVRVLPPCGHAFHVACVDTWLLCTSTCPSCRSALVVVVPAATADPPPCCASAQASRPPEYSVTVERGPCRTSVP